ncbi:glycosyltransferase family 4 protein [Desulfobulbus elongatus]|uniref:glycosyltransferase family 4 protein n=1 Tax=Desulfobulbus elongatus TaxID=53332 RepID=UPI0006849996|nr:glycosyltransferase family 4 protein [Desulfobulbus elongatus]
MKVCFVALGVYPLFFHGTYTGQIGGSELQQKLIGEALSAKGAQVSFISHDVGQPDFLHRGGLTFIKSFAPSAGLPGIRFFHPRLTEIWKALIKADADVCYCRAAGFLPGVLTLFCRIYRKKFVFAGASDTDFLPDHHIIPTQRDKLLYRFGIRRADAIVVQSAKQQALLRANFGRDGIVIRNFHDGEARILPESERRVILWVSTIRSLKRPMLFIQLAQALPQERFVMIGGRDGSNPELFQSVSEQCAALPNLEFLGFQPLEVTERYFDQSKLFVNTSEHEGFPNTFLQAWRRGIPVVSFVDPDDVIRNNSLGCVVIGDQSLPEVVRSVLDAPPDAEKIRVYFQKNHASGVAEQYLHVFGSLVRGA